MVLFSWVKEVSLASTAVSIQFSDFVSKMMQMASERYNYAKQNPREKLETARPVPEGLREYNSKLCVLLLPAVPETVKHRVLSDAEDSTKISAISILDGVWHHVAPGGQEELKGLTRFVRDPGAVNTAEEAIARIRLWMQARKRATVMGIPELSPHEQMQILEKLTKNLEKNTRSLRTGSTK